jgi:Carboxypeptidase regulatory-like domain
MIYADRFRLSLVFAFFATVACDTLTLPRSFGQAVAVASISGQVSDQTGAAVSGAEVTAAETETGLVRKVVSDAQGNYNVSNLPVGPYSLTVSAPGFKTFQQTGIVLQVGNNLQINARLEVGAVTENVQVTASANMVETKDNTVSQVVNQRQIVDLPLNGRQPTQLIVISGAATPAPNGNLISSKNYPSSTTMSVAGGQGNATNYLLDGGDNNDTFSNVNLPFPFPDALQEFSVQTSALPARNGLHPGGVVNVVTKSGTNAFHGDVFEFLRNGAVNARNFFAPAPDTLKRNQYGGTVGGKIITDRLFFFGGYQGTRNRQNPPSTVAFVPTPQALSGDFSALESAGCQSSGKVRTIIDPATGQPFPNAQVPLSRFDPVALQVMKHLPVADNPCGRVTFGIPSTGDEDQAIGRIDFNLASNHTLFGRYFLADYRNPAVYDPGNLMVTQRAGNLERSQSVTLGDSYILSPRVVNSFHSTFTRLRNNRGPASDAINAADLGANMFNFDPNGMQLAVSGAFSTGCGTCAPGFFNRNVFQEADDVDIIHGRHQLAFGVDFIRIQNNLQGDFNENGNFQFNGQYTNDPMVDFLLGDMSLFAQSRAQVNVYRQSVLALYGQDTFKVNSRFLINMGLRWEPMLFPQDYFGRGESFSLPGFYANQHSTVFTNAPAGLFFYGDPNIPKAFTHDKWKIFSPRLGIVWNPHGDGRDTLRVGGAILYDSAEVYYAERLTTNPPYAGEIDLQNAGPLSNPWRGYPGGNPFPGSYPPPANVTFPVAGTYAGIPLDLHPTYMTQWNVSYERQLANNWLASISYLGNKTTHIWLGYDLNPAVYIPGKSTTANTDQRRVFNLANPAEGQYYGQMIVTDDGGNATYNGLLASIQHRFSHGFTFLANYTWSHCIDDGDFTGNVGNEIYQNQSNRRADRGDCNYDIRHMVNATFVGTSPGWGNSFLKRVTGNWQLAPLLRVASGFPVAVVTGKDNSLTGVGKDRPNLVPGVDPYLETSTPRPQWFNPAAFVANPTGTFGNLGRDVMRAPGQFNIDVALSRIFAATERLKLEVRAEAFNAINHTNFLAPNPTVTNAQFGRITAANDPRIFQFAMKLHF